MSVTLKHIAEQVGVSHTSVYKALNNKPGLSAETRKAILKKAKELGYVPNVIARGLVSNRSSFIGVLVPNVLATCFSKALQGIEDVVGEFGFAVILCTTRDQENILFDKVKFLKSKRVEGVIMAPGICCSDKVKRLLNDMSNSNWPVTVFNVFLEGTEVPCVVNDNVLGGYLATKHLIKLGHKRILHLHGPASDLTSKHKYQGYCQALSEASIEVHDELIAVAEKSTREVGYRLVKEAIEKRIDFTGVFAFYDDLALGAYQALKECGLQVPEDVALVGYDDIDASQTCEVPLTTIHYDKKEVGRIAADILLRQLNREISTVQSVLIRPELVIRDSCGAR